MRRQRAEPSGEELAGDSVTHFFRLSEDSNGNGSDRLQRHCYEPKAGRLLIVLILFPQPLNHQPDEGQYQDDGQDDPSADPINAPGQEARGQWAPE
jgi:hypothetical protein